MLSDYIAPGDKIEMEMAGVDRSEEEAGERKIYSSRISEILSEDQIDIMMPIEKGKLVLLPIDSEYMLYFYTHSGGQYQCSARITDRYRMNNMYILTLDLNSGLQKLQRRAYYRFAVVLELSSRLLRKEEVAEMKSDVLFSPSDDEPMSVGTIVDISGGGLRFVSSDAYEHGDIILCKYTLPIGEQGRTFRMVGRVLRVLELTNRAGSYEHRIQFTIINEDDREEIIHYIFEQERRKGRRI